MDPDIHFEQSGLEGDRSQAEGVEYLRRLKAQHTEDAARDCADAGPILPAAQSSTPHKERRHSPRFPCSGSVEFREGSSNVRMWGTLTDISLTGCYVEMSTTFPVSTNVDLVLDSAGIRIHTPATVRASYPFLGMGLRFMGIEAEQRSRLEQILAALAGQKAIVTNVPPEEPGLAGILASADPYAFVEHLAEFFKKNAELSRDEFSQIAQRVRRS